MRACPKAQRSVTEARRIPSSVCSFAHARITCERADCQTDFARARRADEHPVEQVRAFRKSDVRTRYRESLTARRFPLLRIRCVAGRSKRKKQRPPPRVWHACVRVSQAERMGQIRNTCGGTNIAKCIYEHRAAHARRSQIDHDLPHVESRVQTRTRVAGERK